MTDPEPTAAQRLQALLAGVRSRGEIKRLGARIDGDPDLRGAALGALVDPDAAEGFPGKRLVRMLLDREAQSQVRTNPIHRDEPFACLHCGRPVSPGGRPVRDHCPHCLRSRHLDDVPGDRAAGCGALMDPVRFELDGALVRIHYRCRRCGHAWRGRAHPDDAIPPSLRPADLPGPAAPVPEAPS